MTTGLKFDAKERGMTHREFKKKKREELRAAIAAVRKLNHSAAYCPLYGETIPLLRKLRRMEEQISVKRWGR